MFKGTCCVQLTVQVDKLAQETNRDTGRKRKRIHHVVVQGHAHVPALLFVCTFPVCVLFVYPTLKLKVRALIFYYCKYLFICSIHYVGLVQSILFRTHTLTH